MTEVEEPLIKLQELKQSLIKEREDKQIEIYQLQKNLLSIQQEIEELKIKNEKIKDTINKKNLKINKHKQKMFIFGNNLIKENHLSPKNSEKNLDTINDGKKITKLLKFCKKRKVDGKNYFFFNIIIKLL
jgi:hypothetical protein